MSCLINHVVSYERWGVHGCPERATRSYVKNGWLNEPVALASPHRRGRMPTASLQEWLYAPLATPTRGKRASSTVYVAIAKVANRD